MLRKWVCRFILWWYAPTHLFLKYRWNVDEAVQALNFGNVLEDLADEQYWLTDREVSVVFLTAASKNFEQLGRLTETELYYLETRLESRIRYHRRNQ